MALHQFTATNSVDFLDQVCLHANAQGWVVVAQTATYRVLSIPAGGFVVFIFEGLNLRLQAFREFNPARVLEDQIGGIDNAQYLPVIPLHNQLFTVWLTISGRRIAGVARISNLYHSFYVGLMLPFAQSSKYPFPCFLGGTGYEVWDVSTKPSVNYLYNDSSSYLMPKFWTPSGEIQSADYAIWPFHNRISNLGLTLDGSYVIYPALVISADNSYLSSSEGMWLGYLEGIYAVSNVGASAETIITINLVDYMIIPNVFNASETYALRLS